MKKSAGLVVRTVGFVLKHRQPEATALAGELVRYLLSSKKHMLFARESQVAAKQIIQSHKGSRSWIKVVEKATLVKKCDLILVLGGDGTFLSIARLMQDRSVPIMGINMGQLGFLTEIKRSEALHAVRDILDGHAPLISERSLLEVTLRRKGKAIFQGPVVNDAVISKGAIARIIGVQIWVDDKWVHHVRADGVIVSTTTGSTAYALAAGGPLLEPSLPALVIAPICPHSLTLRPLVVSDRSEVRLCLDDRPGPVVLTLDGQDAVELKEGDIVTIKKFKKHCLQLISSPSRSYYSLLREKLKYGSRD